MKTQLLQDIGDSGAAPVGPDGRGPPRQGLRHEPPRDAPQGSPPGATPKPRPAVWHRAPAGPDTTAQLPGADDGAERPAAASAASAAAAPAADDFATAPGLATAREPDWLAELMRQDAERADARQKAGRLQRRLFGWSIGAGVLALVAAGVLWMIEERRTDGALQALAATRPAAVVPGLVPEAAPAVGPAVGPAAAPALPPVLSSPRPAPTILEEVVKPAEPVSTEPAMPGIRREHAASKAASKAPAERVQSDRRKREETLLQCRALGYDEPQCIRRECGMTRFGLACRGGVMGEDVPP